MITPEALRKSREVNLMLEEEQIEAMVVSANSAGKTGVNYAFSKVISVEDSIIIVANLKRLGYEVAHVHGSSFRDGSSYNTVNISWR